jgi:putative NADPH-quinone reductase
MRGNGKEDAMTRIAIIDGHPDPDRSRFVHALADAYADSATRFHCVERIDIATLDFPLLRSPENWRTGAPPPGIAAAQETIRRASHLAIFYPLWLGDVPALLKGFLEQVARPGFAIAQSESGFPKQLLKGRSARVVVTMGMPASFYSIYFRAHSLKSLERNILRFSGIKPVKHCIIGSVESNIAYRESWLSRMRELGAKGE